jgi:hypothetical protein
LVFCKEFGERFLAKNAQGFVEDNNPSGPVFGEICSREEQGRKVTAEWVGEDLKDGKWVRKWKGIKKREETGGDGGQRGEERERDEMIWERNLGNGFWIE